MARLAIVLALALIAAAPGPASASYEVGAATRSINPTQDELGTGKVFLGGYGVTGLPGVARFADGILGEGASVRAFAIADGRGGGFAVADMEVQGWFAAAKDGPYGIVDMRRAVEQATHGELTAEQVVVQSDHSHAGMDAMGVWGGIPLSTRKRIFDRTVAALVEAWETRERAASLHYGSADAMDLLSNQFAYDPNNQEMDRELRVLQARDAAGRPLVTLLNFSAHTTVLGSGNTKVSGDWVQRANPLLEEAVGGEAVTLVGTLGRSQPARADCPDPLAGGAARDLCKLDAYAGRVVERARVALANAEPLPADPVVAARSYLIQDAGSNPALLGLMYGGKAVMADLNRSMSPPWLTANVIGTVTGTLRVGDVLIGTIPGEAYPQIPGKVRTLLGGAVRGYMTMGLAQDQLGYLIAPFPDAYGEPICATVFDGCEDTLPSGIQPVANDTYAFNVSHTMGERVTCSLLRGAAEVLEAERAAYDTCAAFANDDALPHGADTGRAGDGLPRDPVQETSYTGDHRRSGQLKAGVGQADTTYHVGSSAGQYASTRDGNVSEDGFHGPIDPSAQQVKNVPSYGVQSRLSARAIVIEGADGARAAIVKNDLYIPQDMLWRRTAQILEASDTGIGRENLTMAVTHNHSSPYYSSLGWGAWAFQDVFDVRFYEYYAQQMAKAVEEAAANLVPVRVGASVGSLDKPHRHSFGPATADDGTPAGYPQSDADHDLTVLRFDDISGPEPKPLAVLMNYSLHPEFLEGNDLISADYVGPLERMVDRATGALTILTQGAVGTAEPERSSYHSVHERLEFSHRDYAQAEYGARLIADEVLETWRGIAEGRSEQPGRFVPFFTEAPVAMADRWYPGPLSHPYPGVSNCRTDQALAGNPGIPIVGLPDCNRDADLRALTDATGFPGVSTDDLQALGVPVPENYSAPSYVSLQESAEVHLQALRIGEILLTMCSCEQWKDQSENIETRTDSLRDNQYLGHDWTALMDKPAPVTDHHWRRMRAQVRNDAVGWDFVENVPNAESEPAEPSDIRGNYTHEELAPESGYALTVPIGMANDYNGYIATYREYQRGDHYRKALTGFGPHSSDYLATRLVELAGHLKEGPEAVVLPTEPERALADQIGSLKIAPDLAHNDARARALGEAAGPATAASIAKQPPDPGPAAVTEQPADEVERFGAGFVEWRGGDNFVDNPVVRVQRRAEGGWEEFADQSGEVPVTLDLPTEQELAAAATGAFEWRWTARFEAFVAPFDTGGAPGAPGDGSGPRATPAGDYRFVIDGHRHAGGGAVEPYHLESEPFTVRPWEGITASDLRLEPDGRASFAVGPVTEIAVPAGRADLKARRAEADATAVIGPIDYPDSYAGRIPFIREQRELIRDPDQPAEASLFEWFCFTCTFRPWLDTGDVERAQVTVTSPSGRAEKVAALQSGGRWVAARALRPGERAVVAAGDVIDPWGNRNGEPSNAVDMRAGR